jgi:hypothetical protein
LVIGSIVDGLMKVTYNRADMKQNRLDLRVLPIRERIRLASAADASATELAERYAVSHAYIFQLRTLLRLSGKDGEAIKDAIDEETLACARATRALQAMRDEGELAAVQKKLLLARSKGRRIARGFDPTASISDKRRTRSGRRKRNSS